MHLQERWERLWADVGGGRNDSRDESFRQLVARYGELHRAYHTLVHVESCLRLLDRHVRPGQHQRLALEWAIWLHDAQYDPRASDNEARSKKLSSRFLENAGAERAFERYTNGLILATRFGHVPVSEDERLLVDIDHSILGEPAEVFDGYDRGIRREYGFVPWIDYVAHRTSVLREFLDRQPFFHTVAFRGSDHERRVRPNLLRALDRLASGPDPLLAS